MPGFPRFRGVLALPALVLAACTLPPPEPPRLIGPPDQMPAPQADLSGCGGQALAAYLGQPVAAFPATGDWGTLRLIRPGMAVTMDYSDSRLNLTLDDQDRIQALACG